jgi:hypothetical protein
MQLVGIPQAGLLTANDDCALPISARHAQDREEADSKITNASASTPASGAFAFRPENREVIH